MTQEGVFAALHSEGTIDDGLILTHLVHVGDLQLPNEEIVHVVYLGQTIPGMLVPRGQNSVVLMNSNLSTIAQYRLKGETPRRCIDNRLYFDEPIELLEGFVECGGTASVWEVSYQSKLLCVTPLSTAADLLTLTPSESRRNFRAGLSESR